MPRIHRPTPALVVAVIALVGSMAGTGYAAAKLSGTQLKKRSVPANRIVPNVLGGEQVDESLLGQVPSAVAADTAEQADDAKTLAGNLPAAFMPSRTTARIRLVANVAVNAGAEGTAECLAGEQAISGGGAWYEAGTDTTIGSGTLSTSAPAFDAQGAITGWRAEGKNTSAVARDFRAWVVCAG